MKLKKEEKKIILKAARYCNSTGTLNDSKVRLMIKLIKKNSLSSAYLMLKNFQKAIKSILVGQTIIVNSPQNLSSTLKSSFNRIFKSRYPKMRIDYQIDPSLIAGIKLKIRDEIFDASLKGKLTLIKENI